MPKKEKTEPPLLFESIRLHDGELPLLALHQERVDRSRRVHFPKTSSLKLAPLIEELDLPNMGLYKLRLVYGRELERHELIPYSPREIGSLRLVDVDPIEYSRKYTDRDAIQRAYARRGDCDDVIMVHRNHLQDSSYANIALYDGRYWYTPAWPLLRGVRREQLIREGIIRPAVIRRRDLVNFDRVRLINAMMEWEESPEISRGKIE